MTELNLRRVLIKNTGVQMIAQAVSLAIGLATSAVLSRYLGVEGFGQFNYIFAFFYFFLTINDFGVNTIVVREVSKHHDRANEIIGAMQLFKLLLAAVCVLGAWATIWAMKFPADLRNSLCLFALILPLIALQLPGVIFQATLKAEYPAIVGVINRCGGFLLMMGAVAMGSRLTGIVAALLVGELIALLVLLKWARRFVRPVWRPDPELWMEVLRSSIPLGIMGLFVATINRVDFMMLERMTDLQQVGLYSAAYKVVNLLEAFPLMIMGTIYPVMSRYASEDLGQLRVLYKKCVAYLGLVALPMGIGITLLAPWIVRVLFGDKFVDSSQGLRVLVWSSVFLYLALSGGNLLISLGKEKVNLAINALGAMLNVGLNLVLIPSLGFVGAALSTAGTYLFILIAISASSYTALYCQPAGSALIRVKDAET
jgi:O-antigen/teichoic acid export membrane protein